MILQLIISFHGVKTTQPSLSGVRRNSLVIFFRITSNTTTSRPSFANSTHMYVTISLICLINYLSVYISSWIYTDFVFVFLFMMIRVLEKSSQTDGSLRMSSSRKEKNICCVRSTAGKHHSHTLG